MVDIALNIADEYIFDSIYARFYPISIPDNTTITNLQYSLPRFPITSLVTVPWFLGEVRGYSKLYDDINDYGFLYGIFSIILFLFFTDMCEYLSSGTFINGAAHHSLHHLYFNYNYGQYFTLWDKIGGSHRLPGEEQFDRKKKRDQKVWIKQSMEVDKFDENGKEKEE
ncbi:6574_t:CDS:2 [Gigaspora rosea]|nr:6574_t:CDS:2 [Gigaspora rosea]